MVYQRHGEAVSAASKQSGKVVATGWGGYYLKDATPTRTDPPRGGLFEAFQRQGEKK
jgi:hypothetical protein